MLSRAWYQGIQEAEINGRPVTLFPVNGVLTGMKIPAGTSRIVLKVKDPQLAAGWILYLAGWLLAGCLAVLGLANGRTGA